MSGVKDQYEGQGGSYTRDPVTGARTLVERTDYVPAEPAAPAAQAPAAPATPAAETPAAPATNAQGG